MAGLTLPTKQRDFNSLTNYGLTPTTQGAFGGLGSQVDALGNITIPDLAPTTTGGINSWLQDTGFLGRNGAQGWGGMALGALQGIGNTYLGMKQYGLAKDALAANQDQFAKNYAAQQSSYNTQLEDRQRARVAATSGGAESVESYMNRNRL